MPQPQHQITSLLHAWQAGEHHALEQLVNLVNQMLHRQASKLMHHERHNHTLQATALVNEALLDLLQGTVQFVDRLHFFRIASRIMRHILVNYARARNAAKRGNGAPHQPWTESQAEPANRAELLALDQAMQALAEFDSHKAELIELHYFAGLTTKEIADLYGVSTKTIDRHCRLAKAWLSQAL